MKRAVCPRADEAEPPPPPFLASPPPQVESAFQEAAQFALAQENTDADYIPETINLNTPQPTTAGKKGCC